LNQARRRGVLEFEHITFGQQPVAEIDPLELKRLAIRRNELLAFDRHKLRLGLSDRTGNTENDKDSEDKKHSLFIQPQLRSGLIQRERSSLFSASFEDFH